MKYVLALLIVSIILVSVFVIPSSASTEYQDTVYYSTGMLWWKKDHLANIYKETSYFYWHFLDNLTPTIYWDHRAASAVLAIEYTTTVSERTSRSASIGLGLTVPTNYGQVTGSFQYETSYETTYTRENSVIHSRVLDRSSPVGYYSLQAALNSDRYKAYEYTKESGIWTYDCITEFVKFRTDEPFITLRYTTDGH